MDGSGDDQVRDEGIGTHSCMSDNYESKTS